MIDHHRRSDDHLLAPRRTAVLLIGTSEGVYRAGDEIADATRVLDTERVLRVRRFGDDVFAATRSGLFRSSDGGETWSDLGVPKREVYSVVQSPDGERLYAGTHPAHLYVSVDSGESWRELEGLQNLPSRETWYTPRHRNKAHVRSLGVHPDAPERVIAGIEVAASTSVMIRERRGLNDETGVPSCKAVSSTMSITFLSWEPRTMSSRVVGDSIERGMAVSRGCGWIPVSITRTSGRRSSTMGVSTPQHWDRDRRGRGKNRTVPRQSSSNPMMTARRSIRFHIQDLRPSSSLHGQFSMGVWSLAPAGDA